MKLDLLKQYRLERGLTQQQLSTYIDMSYRSYSSKENGQRPFYIGDLEKIFDVLNLSDEEVLSLLDRKNV
ncbi:helix-turn-helix transcriptional regulator [Clostridioides sp. ZZV15-6383]|uniref:helix-turn-helix transcriptional regulator n=1 Tax=Clostridioides sp. ZZV15-6383 TaxID=2811498 RepID=UPI001D0FBEEA|nr:helix-turn-helix transcriptional regulator [Clostridioides sp. ZZV15-6383]